LGQSFDRRDEWGINLDTISGPREILHQTLGQVWELLDILIWAAAFDDGVNELLEAASINGVLIEATARSIGELSILVNSVKVRQN
jgi:hypothetical protein